MSSFLKYQLRYVFFLFRFCWVFLCVLGFFFSVWVGDGGSMMVFVLLLIFVTNGQFLFFFFLLNNQWSLHHCKGSILVREKETVLRLSVSLFIYQLSSWFSS